MERPPATRLLASLLPLFAFQALFQVLQVDAQEPWGWSMQSVEDAFDWIERSASRLWPDDLVWQAVLLSAAIALAVLVAGYRANDKYLSRRRIKSGFAPTAPLMPSIFCLAVLVMVFGPAPTGTFPNGQLLLAAAMVAAAAWIAFAVWRGIQSSPREVAPELYESLKTDYLALRATAPPADEAEANKRLGEAEPSSTPSALDGPLAQERIPGYLSHIGQEMSFEDDHLPKELRIAPRSWNTGSAYLEAQRKLAYVRDSLIAHQDSKAALLSHIFSLKLRVAGSHLPTDTKSSLATLLESEQRLIETGTNPGMHARPIYTVASTLSSYVYGRQKALLRVQIQQHWLVVLVQIIASLILAIAVLAGASATQIGAAMLFFLIGAGSGILSLLHVRQSVANADLGDDYGLFRVELARAFTLSGMAAIIAVLLIANLAVLADTGVFVPEPVATTPGTPEGTPVASDASEAGAPVAVHASGVPVRTLSYAAVPESAPFLLAQEQTATGTSTNTDDDGERERVEWIPLRDIFAFSNLAGLLVALLAGWVPERIFRNLTEYGNRLRLDIQSVSRTGT